MAKKTETPNFEREYVIPLRRKINVVPRYKKTPKAIKTIKEFIVKHMKVRDRDLNKVRIDKYLNEAIWARGIKKPPIKIKVKAIKDINGIVKVELVDFPQKLKFKKLREEKIEEKAKEISKKKKEEKPEQKEETKEISEEKKKEEAEKKSAIVEAGKEMEKAAAKASKHEVGGKVKGPKHQQRKALAK